LALLYLVPRSSTVKAEVDSVVWVIDRMNFKSILTKTSEVKIAEYCKYLEKVPILEPLTRDDKKDIAEALVEMHFDKGEVILEQGEQGNTFYILYEGEVEVYVDGVVVKKLAATPSTVSYFGEMALMHHEPRAATVTVCSERAKALALDRDSFDYLLGPLTDLLEAALGGELYATYNRKGFHGSEKHCMYYTSGVVYAFRHLHERRIMYRDLKPENLLLTEEGFIKLTDMGLAKFAIGKTYTTCGTPDYFAPELIASAGHNHAVDWWTLGILTYELMSGHPPFESPQPMQIYAKVMKGIGKIAFSSKVTGNCAEVVKALLKRNPSERLPMKASGVKGLQDHEWYKEFDWQQMLELKFPVPYKPVVKSKKDLANFHARKEDMPKVLEYKDDGSGWDKDFES